MVYVVTAKFWFRPEALLWDTKAAPVPQPIATSGSTADAVPGAIGQPGTLVVFGGGTASFGYVGGVRLETGIWLDEGRVFGLEAGYFVLIQQSREFSQQSDGFGNPVIARPTIDARSGGEGSHVDSLPDQFLGGVDVILRSEFQGANCDGVLNLLQTQRVRLDGLLGFRYLSLVESLNIYDQSSDFLGGGSTFGGAPLSTSATLSDFDGFRLTNSFYGGSGGARLYYAQGRFYFTALGKIAFGTVQQRATISGSTLFTNPQGVRTMLPGGVLATTANMGNYYQNPYAVAPEGHFNLGYQISPSVTARIGYSFIYLSNVARPGDQVSRVTSANRIPSDPAYGGTGPVPPAFQFHTSTYWAQGLNFGLDFRF
ncbi:MAG TPA: BBP7 family outer membrane beta-barrel protein [Pirellulales bacterium]|nr:BBP7 family outer membrane beta-barrel protein [Pirellulales bacterium]